MHRSEPQSVFGSPQHLRDVIDHAAHLLPAQGPIGVFVHHNTLHAFQHLPFEEAVVKASEIFGSEPFLSEDAYRRNLERGRIREEDISAILSRTEDSGICLESGVTRRSLRQEILVGGFRPIHPSSIEWNLRERDWLRRFRGDLSESAKRNLTGDRPRKLWAAVEERFEAMSRPSAEAATPVARWLNGHAEEIREIVNPLLIRLSAAYLDQGIAYWPMPQREKGFWKASLSILAQPMALMPAGLDGLSKVAAKLERSRHSVEETAIGFLYELEIDAAHWQAFVESELLALPGWGGLIRRLEVQPELAPHIDLPYSLSEFLAVRLLLTLCAFQPYRNQTQVGSRSSATLVEARDLCDVARLFEAAQLCGLNSATIRGLTDHEFSTFTAEVHGFSELERRRLLHLAYERRHERQILVPLAKHRASPSQTAIGSRIAAQVIFCIDEREESMRRHLEEVDPEIETLGAAGFFGVAVDYTGLDDARGAALCPVVIKPKNQVVEKAIDDHTGRFQRRRALRRLWARLFRQGHVSSRTLVRGGLSTATLGLLSLFPLAFRLLNPLAYARLISWLNAAFLPVPRTELALERADAQGRKAAGGLLQGFSVEEKVNCVASILGPAGLHRDIARLVVVLGHGSTSLNNPFESAYDCGACGGRHGGPNARLFASMANHPKVRQGLQSKGIVIPEDTWFVGGYHDTCSDEVRTFDLELIPESHRADLARVRAALNEARARSAHERTRRFALASPRMSFRQALRHVQERSEHLGEPRPEYGHCTNAVCIVGRREITRGLFLDRRSFLVSYDATKDSADEGLARVLGAVTPVCSGINLEYYFSSVDNERYGCGTKLPHNITGLVGVMNGYQGDLRTGLPLQTVEIHEPVRILFVVETTPARLLATMQANAQLNEILSNQWIRLATIDPVTSVINVYRDGVFELLEGDEEPLPVARSSRDWYRGKIEHLPVARIQQGGKSSAA
jgi:hypothetical protein